MHQVSTILYQTGRWTSASYALPHACTLLGGTAIIDGDHIDAYGDIIHGRRGIKHAVKARSGPSNTARWKMQTCAQMH